MSDIAIRVEHLTKQYTIGSLQHRPDTLRDRLMSTMQRLRPRLRHMASPPTTIRALEDVSFEVKQGEVLGIVGRNGAGKSTLLKLLSRITEPTRGRAELYGRVASLLEVGTGFHGELTGRENVYLNGAILGMSREEISRKFDEIVAFSGIEKFIDTPVKRYSSGMTVRLAFAVAAHLESEILIIDEVLAVGDAAFQRKCLGKMGEVARSGRTVLFVSHNMGAIINLCSSAVWLNQGEVRAYGDIHSTTNAYLTNNPTNSSSAIQWHRSGTGEAQIMNIHLWDTEGNQRESFMMGETIVVEFDIECHRPCPSFGCGLAIRNLETGLEVLELFNEDCGLVLPNLDVGCYTFRVQIPNCMLYPSSYTLTVWAGIFNGALLDAAHDAINFEMYQGDVSKRTFPFNTREGVYYQPSLWAIQQRS
jgi:lipopolysaccharide transport system ATP-binding protein